jgi:hypothetical protein
LPYKTPPPDNSLASFDANILNEKGIRDFLLSKNKGGGATYGKKKSRSIDNWSLLTAG